MNRQFYEGVRTKDIIDQLKPKTIMEIGFGAGTNVMMLLAYSLKPGNGYKLISLSDQATCPFTVLPNEFCVNFLYINGVSYKRIPELRELKLPQEFDKLIDFCIIDSDHNYYTLKKELTVIDQIMSPTCVIALHDTASKPCEHHLMYKEVTNVKSNAMFKSNGYDDGSQYPFNQIMDEFDIPMMKAVDEFLEDHKDYKKIKHLDECCGCTVLGRNFDYEIKKGEKCLQS